MEDSRWSRAVDCQTSVPGHESESRFQKKIQDSSPPVRHKKISMKDPIPDDAKDWSTENIVKWLDSIALGHKADVISESGWDGGQLLAASSDDLQSIGFSGLQAKKILRELQDYKEEEGGESEAAAEGASDNQLRAENASLKQEIDELRSMVMTLQQQVNSSTTTRTGAAPAVASLPSMTTTTQVIPGFCRKAVIEGAQTQVLVVHMGPGDIIRAEPGAMVHQSWYIKMDAKTGGQGLGRWMTGQKVFLAEFSYVGPVGTADTICFTPNFPSQIVPINLDQYQGKVICQKGTLLASGATVNVSVEFSQSLGAGFFGGEGFILQGLNGSGMVFVSSRGTVVKKELSANERLIVSTGNLVAFTSSVRYDITNMGGGLMNDFFGGEGFFVSEMTGPGTVWIESHDMSQLWRVFKNECARIARNECKCR